MAQVLQRDLKRHIGGPAIYMATDRTLLTNYIIEREIEFQLGRHLREFIVLSYPLEAKQMALDDFSERYIQPKIRELVIDLAKD